MIYTWIKKFITNYKIVITNYLGDKVDCTGDDHMQVSSYMACHKTTQTLHISATQGSSSYSDKSLWRSEDKVDMDLYMFTTSLYSNRNHDF